MKSFFVFLLSVTAIGIVLGGFYLTLSELKTLRDEVETVETTIRLAAYGSPPSLPPPIPPSVTSSLPSDARETLGENASLLHISSAIVFTVRSSPRLQPQINVPILIDGVSQNDRGEITLSVKAFTGEAAGYSALDAQDIFELVDFSASNVKPAKVDGSFDSMPPQSAVSGTILFMPPRGGDSFILQINTGERVIHYEFNFKKKTYRETVLG